MEEAKIMKTPVNRISVNGGRESYFLKWRKNSKEKGGP